MISINSVMALPCYFFCAVPVQDRRQEASKIPSGIFASRGMACVHRRGRFAVRTLWLIYAARPELPHGVAHRRYSIIAAGLS